MSDMFKTMFKDVTSKMIKILKMSHIFSMFSMFKLGLVIGLQPPVRPFALCVVGGLL